MPHRLAEPGTSAIAAAPMTAALRYRCACGNKELLTIQAVMDSEMDEQRFVMAMRQLWRDMQTEIRQHLRDQA
jgi:hypothetical protein